MPFIAVQSSDEKEILHGKTNRAYIFSNFVVIFICLTVSVHFLLSSMVSLYHVNGMIAIACCDGEKSITCTICSIYSEPSPLPF